MDRRTDLTMFAGYHLGWLIKSWHEGRPEANFTFDEVQTMVGEYMDQVQPVDPDEKEMQHTFELRWAADMRAIKRWQAAHPGNDLVWPDHADLVVWLMEELDAQRSRSE